MDSDFGDLTVRMAGEIWGRPGLSSKERAFISIAGDVCNQTGLAEDPQPGALVGELISVVLKEQFEALRDGDRCWYEAALPPEVLEQVRNATLADIIRRNTSIGPEISDDVFHVRRKATRKRRRR